MNKGTQIKLAQLATIIVAWLIVGFLISVYDHLVLLTQNSRGPSDQYSFVFSLGLNLGSALVGALLGGSFMVFYINVRYQDKPYAYTIGAVSISFVLVILLIMGIVGFIFVSAKTGGRPLGDPAGVQALKAFLLDSTRIKNIMTWFLVVVVTQLLMQINSKFGQGALVNIIRGKYNTPQAENRVFMFLDLNASTAIAEQLGDEKYHSLLKDFFADITNAIIDNNGEIYQYVGDEVVVAWPQSVGVADNRCIRCFFDIKQQIQNHRAKYLKRYGLVPSFKCGVHCGRVVAGEVGVLKREITYSGDVLNTTSRMLSMCKEFGAELISSGQLLAQLCLDNKYTAQPLGSIQLRGKEQQIALSAIASKVQV
jgi:adenylate cyclase